MTKQDFIFIANILKEANNLAAWCFDDEQDQKRIAAHFADHLSRTNPNFDRARFIDYVMNPEKKLKSRLDK